MNASLRRLTARGVLALTLLTATGGTTSATAAPAAPPAGGSEVAAAAQAPGIAEIRAIAEAGFIYGLPLVMN